MPNSPAERGLRPSSATHIGGTVRGRTTVAAAVATVALLAGGAYASGALKLDDQPPKPPNHPVVGPKRLDAETAKMIDRIDPARVKAADLALVSFGTRNTLSSQTDPVRGIGAARDWIYDQFQQIAATSGGRMTVELQSYTQGVSTGIPTPTVITNVVATLHGTDPAAANRYYYVSGHYDSRCGSTTNATCDAPGANDDASGVTAVLELARVMATHEFDANIVFMAVAGEEQNLYGSARAATLAQQAGQDVQGMFTNDIIGSSLGGNGISNPYTVRLFAEGVPTNETTGEANTRRSIGGENDSPARQMARVARSVAVIPRPGCTSRSCTAATGSTAAATISRSSNEASARQSASPSRTRTSTTSTRTSGSTITLACRSATCPSSSTSITSPGSRR